MIKKIAILILVSIFIVGCTSNRKKTVNYKLSKYPKTEFIAEAGTDFSETKAMEKAIFKIMDKFPTLQGSAYPDIEKKIVDSIRIDETWENKDTGETNSIAIMQRDPIKNALKQDIDGLMLSLAGYEDRINKAKDKFEKVKYAMSISKYSKKASFINEQIRVIDYENNGYREKEIKDINKLVSKTLAELKVVVVFSTEENEIIKTSIVKALNELGLQADISLENPDIEIEASIETVSFDSQTMQGLYWAESVTTVSLKDMETQGIFARFTHKSKDGSFREERAVTKSFINTGEEIADKIYSSLYLYINDR
ncbi:MAG: hypothetical protein HN833_00215 [Elusimicrobiaceae bacterium]|jgi:hypothetical protein|nr:hypothetical protein [Elusimicrobiaceae bacterium]MBT3954712.1 hypothetical protein [Elusimicrobiaceae bacterium]MBT4007741.1 hypothetical protein [Elusimicrobiaceae bacterium]MBT5987677.1 hypothetical protein [Elusimicrobiaceae bacterium]MBT6715705.1 hypothetical protein [Elusimicrobiaceae bacterium]